MASIIKLSARENGMYMYATQSHRQYPENWNGEGWAPVPPVLEKKLRLWGPWARPVVDETGGVIDLVYVEHVEPIQPAAPTEEEDAAGLLVDHEYRLTLLELGVI